MSMVLRAIVSGVASLVILVIVFIMFDPLISGVFAPMAADALNTGVGTALDQNVGALESSRILTLAFFGLFPYILTFVILMRTFILISWKTEEGSAY